MHLRKHNLRIKQVPHQAFKGLYAYDASKNKNTVVFETGQEIGQYIGELLTIPQMAARYHYKVGRKTVKPTYPYVARISATKHIDAACKRGATAFMNGSGHGYTHKKKPNAKFVPSSVHNSIRVKATRPIKHDDEILVSYGRGYFGRAKIQLKHNTTNTRKCNR